MSMNSNTTVEERVVEMRIDNSKFEDGAKKTIGILERLDKALHLHANTDEIDKLNRAVGGFDASPMANGLDSLQHHFTALEIVGMRVISNLTDSVYNFTAKTIKNLTIDQVTAGWDKYADKTSAIQTIMAATRKDIGTLYADEAEQMAAVNAQMDKLNWFTDETSYSFLDMVNNIGKFTSNGRGLEESVTAMMGISTWAAISGAKVQEASRAMYNLSQALGTGSVQVRDWMSIENANMATYEFKQMAIETAEALGTLKKVSDGVWESLDGNTVTVESFRENLKDDWFTSDVLLETLQNYGEFTEALRIATEETDTTATEFLRAMEKYESGESVDKNLIPWIQELSKAEYDLGRRAFQAAQEAKTFQEAIDATKDAVSTGWMNTFEIIFGDYKKAKGFWTDIANDLWELFAGNGESRNDMLRQAFGEVDEFINRGDLFRQALVNILDRIVEFKAIAGEAFSNVFGTPEERGEILGKAIEQFHSLTEQLTLNEDGVKGLKNIFEVLFRVIGLGTKILGIFFRIAGIALGVVYKLVDRILTLFSKLSGSSLLDTLESVLDYISGLIDNGKEFLNEFLNSPIFEVAFKTIETTITSISAALKNAKGFAGELLSFIEPIGKILLSVIGGFIGGAFIGVLNLINLVAERVGGVTIDLQKFLSSTEGLQGIWTTIDKKLKNIKQSLKDGVNFIKQGFQDNGIVGAFQNLWDGTKTLVKEHLPAIYNFLKNIRDTLKEAGTSFLSFLNFESFESFFSSIPGYLGTGLLGLGSLLTTVFGGLLAIITNVINGLTGVNFNVEEIKGTFEKFREIITFIFNGIFNDPKELKERVSAFVSEIWAGFLESVEKISLRDMVKALRITFLIALSAKIMQVISTFKKIADEAKTIPESISNTIQSGGRVFNSFSKSIQANTIIKMAVALGLVAIALYGLTKIDEDKLTHAAAVITVVMAILTLLARAIKGVNSYRNFDYKSVSIFGTLGGTLVGLGIVIAVIANAIYKLSTITNPDQLYIAIGTVIGIIASIILSLAALNLIFRKTSAEETVAIGKVLIKFSLSLMFISFAIGLIALPIIALMAATAYVQNKLGNTKSLETVFGGLKTMLLCIALIVGLIGATIGFGQLNAERIQATGTMLLKAAAALMLVSKAIKMLVLPIIALTAGIAFLENYKFGGENGKALGLSSLEKALGIMAQIAISILGIALVLSLISLIPFKPAKILAIAGAIAILSFGMLLLAPALVILTAALAAFAYVLKDVENFDKGIERLGRLVGILVGFSAAALLFGIAIAAVGIGLAGTSISVIIFAASILIIVKAIGALLDISDKFIAFMKKLYSYITWDNAKKIGAILIAIIALTAALLAAGKIIKWIVKLFSSGFSISTYLSKTAATLGQTLPKFFKNLGTKVMGFLSEHTGLILQFLNGFIVILGLYLMGIIPTLTDTIVQAITVLFSSLAKSINDHEAELRKSIVEIVSSIIDLFEGVFADLWDNASFLEKVLFGAGGAMGATLLVAKFIATLKKAMAGAATIVGGGAGEAAAAGAGAAAAGVGAGAPSAAGAAGAAGTAAKSGALANFLSNPFAYAAIPVLLGMWARDVSENKDAKVGLENLVDEKMLQDDIDKIQAYIQAIEDLKSARTLLTNVEDEEITEQDIDNALRRNNKAVKQAYQELADELGITVEELKQYEVEAIKLGGNLTTAVEKIQENQTSLENQNGSGTVDKIASEFEKLSNVLETIPDAEQVSQSYQQAAGSIDEMKSKLKELDLSGFAKDLGIDINIDSLSDTELTSLFNEVSSKFGIALDSSSLGSTISEKLTNLIANPSISQEEITSKYENLSGWITTAIGNVLGSSDNEAIAGMHLLTNNLEQAERTDTGTNSPSTVYEELAKWIPIGMANGINANANVVVQAMQNLLVRIQQPFQNIQVRFQQYGVQVVRGVVIGINSNVSAAYNAGVNLANAVNRGYSETLKIHSPSQVFEYLSSFIPEGAALGIERNEAPAITAIVGLGKSLVDAAQRAMRQAGYVASNQFDFHPSITPVMDLNSVAYGYQSLSDMFAHSPVSAGTQSLRAPTPTFPDNSINYSISNQNKDVIEEIKHLSEKVAMLGEAFEKTQMVLDSGVLVGHMAPGINRELGVIAARERRQ